MTGRARLFPGLLDIAGVLLIAVVLISSTIAVRAQSADVTEAINKLVEKLTALQSDKPKLTTAIKQLDTAVAALRKDDSKAAIEELTKWIAALTDAQKEAARQDAALQALLKAADRLMSGDDLARASQLAAMLVDRLKSGRMKNDEWEERLSKSLAELSTEMDKFFKDRPLRIHIISAQYGDLETDRTCDAKSYFRSKCEGHPHCPVSTTSNSDPAPLSITGSELCGYEPAPLAGAGVNKAEVSYACVRFGKRSWDDVEREYSSGKKLGNPLTFVGKGRITCDATRKE